MKKCSRCREFKSLDSFTPTSTGTHGVHGYCRACHSAYTKERYQSDPIGHAARQRPNSKRMRVRLREDAVAAYGSMCACCGETSKEFLAIDHIHGGGKKHREEVGSGHDFYRWLKRNGYPPGFRILCHNCNQSLGAFGYCPHKTQLEIAI